jgi:hypothetical protein
MNTSTYTPGQIAFITFLHANRTRMVITADNTVSRKDLVAVLADSAYIAVPAWIASDSARRRGRGHYWIPELASDPATLPVNGNTRGRKPGSPNRKGQNAPAPAPAPTTV